MLNYIEFCGDGFGRDVISADSPQFEGIEGNRLLRAEEIRPNPATIALVKFFVYVIAGSNGLSGLPCSRSGRSEKRPIRRPVNSIFVAASILSVQSPSDPEDSLILCSLLDVNLP